MPSDPSPASSKQSQTSQAASGRTAIVVPPALREKHPQLIELILGSESMNDEERQYWINILPVMTDDQIQNLHQILKNERDQLAAIDAKYQKEMDRLGKGKSVEEMGKMRREQSVSRQQKEGTVQQEETEKEQEILKAIAELEE